MYYLGPTDCYRIHKYKDKSLPPPLIEVATHIISADVILVACHVDGNHFNSIAIFNPSSVFEAPDSLIDEK